MRPDPSASRTWEPAAEADAVAWKSQLDRDGYAIIRAAAPRELISALAADLEPRFQRTPFCDGEFYGRRTKRFGGVLKRSAHAEALVRHPLILAITDLVLGPWCDCYQLNLTQALQLHPGQYAQPPHRDEDMWRGVKGEIEYLVNVMWPFTPYTAANGATLVYPESHNLGRHRLQPRDPIAAEMEPGDALVFLGSTLHGGGANTSDAPRAGLIVSYSLGWLRPYENQWLVYPPEVARGFSPELAALVGYRQHRPNLGNYEGRCPSILLGGSADEYLGAADALLPEQAAALAELAARRAAANQP